MNQAYINGFVKRAAEYGLNHNQAIEILKQATVADNTHTLNINSKPAVQPTAPKPLVKTDPMRLSPLNAYGPKINIPPAPAPEHVPNNYLANQKPPTEQEIQGLADVPPSSMTPKDNWTQGLHDILAKRPPNQLRNIYVNKPTEGMDNSANMQRWQNTMNLRNATYEAIYPGYMEQTQPLPKDVKTDDPRVASMGHIKELAAHMNKYDPSWGDSFRIPIADEPVYESDDFGDFKSRLIQSDRDGINNNFKYYLKLRKSPQVMNSDALANNVNIPTGL